MSSEKSMGPERLPGIQAAVFSPDLKTLMTGAFGGVLAAWDSASGQRKGSTTLDSSPLTVCYMSGGEQVLVGDAKGRVTLRDALSREELLSWQAHEAGVVALDVSPDGRWVAAGARVPGGETLKVWRFTGEMGSAVVEAFSVHRHVTAVYSIAFSADSRFVAAGGWTNSTYTGSVVYELETGHRVKSLNWEASRALQFQSDGKTLASGDDFGKVSIWDLDRSTRSLEVQGHKDMVSLVRFSPDGRTLASGSVDGSLKFWDVATGALAREFTLDGIVLDARFIDEGQTLLVASAPKGSRRPDIHRLALS